MASTDIGALQEKIRPIVGMAAWEVKLGWGCYITFEFGAPIVTDGGYTHGEWHLWIEHVGWRIETNGEFIAGSEDSREGLITAVKCMENTKIVAIDISPPALQTTIRFENGIRLRLFPVYTSSHKDWIVF